MLRRESTYTGTTQTLVTTAETVIATLTGISTERAGQKLTFRGHAVITPGTAATAIQIRVRLGTVAGAEVGTSVAEELSTAVGSDEHRDVFVEDSTGVEFGSRTYVMTAQQVAATGNASVLVAGFECEISP